MTGDLGSGQADRLLARVACTMFLYGQTTEGTRRSFDRAARAIGRRAFILMRWGSVAVTDGGGQPIMMSATEPTAVDIGRVVGAERLMDDLCHGRITPLQGTETLAELDRAPAVGLSRFAGMAAAGAGALGVIFGAPDVPTLCVIAFVAGLGAILRRSLSRWSGSPFLQPFAAAFLAGAAGGGWPRLQAILGGAAGAPGIGHYLVIVCPCMVLVPGPHFLNGTIDLARAHIALGASRLAFATLVVLSISVGVLAGLALVGTPLPTVGGAGLPPLGYDVVAAGIAVAAYGSFFNMPWSMLPAPIAIGMLAHGTRWFVVDRGASLQTGAFVACLIVGTLMTPVAQRLRMPFGACAFAAVVSLVPGALMFAAFAGLTAMTLPGAETPPATLSLIVGDAVETTLVLLAMTAGLIVPKMVIDSVRFRA